MRQPTPNQTNIEVPRGSLGYTILYVEYPTLEPDGSFTAGREGAVMGLGVSIGTKYSYPSIGLEVYKDQVRPPNEAFCRIGYQTLSHTIACCLLQNRSCPNSRFLSRLIDTISKMPILFAIEVLTFVGLTAGAIGGPIIA